MKKINSSKKFTSKKAALVAGAAALAALVPNAHAQSSVDSLLNKLEQKGILTADETKALRAENEMDATNDFNAALNSKFPLSPWVTSLKFGGDFRGRFEQFAGDNNHFVDRTRERYRIRFGVTATLADNLEMGLRLASGDPGTANSYNNAGNPLSANSSMQDDFTKKNIYVDVAYGKWTMIKNDSWMLSATIGKMDNPFNFTPMIFDADLTPEGGAVQGNYVINNNNSIAFTGAAFVMDEEKTSTMDPFMFGGQAILNSKWNSKWASTLGIGAFDIVNPKMLTVANVPYINQGNTRTAGGVLVNRYVPVIADASVTYTLDKFPLYQGAFPIRASFEYVNNTAISQNQQGYWAGVTFGKSGKKHTWDLTYRYEYLEADAWFDQVVDDDNGTFYQNAPTGGAAGFFGGTNIKGHFVKLNYSITDSLTFSAQCFINDLINTANEPNSHAFHAMADLMWKF